MKKTSNSSIETINLGKMIGKRLKPGDIICLFGQLGSGKTVLTKGIAKALSIDTRDVISPSFVLIREYQGKLPLYHFDLYRLETVKNIFELGYEEYLYDEGVTVIEWADRLKNLLPKEHLAIQLINKDNSTRAISIKAVGQRYKRLLNDIQK